MNKAEKYIERHINRYSNEDDYDYFPWITPDDAIEAIKIAREEVVEKVCELLKDAQMFVVQTPQFNYFDYKKAIEHFRKILEK